MAEAPRPMFDTDELVINMGPQHPRPAGGPRGVPSIGTILAELQRIASHALWLGTHAMDIGAMTVFLYCFRERELVLDLFEEYCGARLTYNSMRIGGLPYDLPPGWDRKVREFCTILEQKIVEYEQLLNHNRIWLQ